jgi:hypothetical protein
MAVCAGVGDTVAGVDVAVEDVVAGGCCKWGLLIKAFVRDFEVMLLQDGNEICTGVGGAVGAGGDCESNNVVVQVVAVLTSLL